MENRQVTPYHRAGFLVPNVPQAANLLEFTMPTVKFINDKKSIEVPEGANLRKQALKHGIELYTGPHRYLNCMGNGMCCSCSVLIKKGEENVSRRGFWERLNMLINPLGFFSRIGHEEEMRLACQTKVYGDCEVETRPGLNMHGEKFWH